jgi:hypothetical protein
MAEPRKPGGRRSLENLANLRASRLGIAARSGRTISDLQWRLAQSYAIQRDDRREFWHAGHVSAILSDGFIVIAGAQTGGVWLLTPVNIPHYRQGHQAVPLSDEWDAPDVLSLAYGPEGHTQVYVGGTGVAALVVLEFQPVLGGMVHQRTTNIPLPGFFDIYAIVVFTQPRRIVIATSSGVWWSTIPAAVNDAASYTWQMGQNLPGGTYSGLAAGQGESVAAAAYGDSWHNGIFRGAWQGGTLTFSASTITGASAASMLRTSLASCADHRERMYAVAAAADDSIYTVLISRDSGASWQTVMIPPNHGNQGFYNNCLAVSPYRPDVVALGWRASGPYISTNAGTSWQQPATDQNNANMHSDLHALYFARNSSNGDHLYVGSDGGIVVTTDVGQSFTSQFNRPLSNLQFYGAGKGTTAGAFTISSKFFGLAAGGTQDNGNIYLLPDSDAGSAWHTLEGGDGGLNRFVDSINALLRFNNTLVVNNMEIGNRVRIAFWDANAKSFGSGWGTVVPVDGNAAGITPNAMDIVLFPAWKKNNQVMYALVGVMSTVYGLFANGNGTDAKLLTLGQAADTISALGSFEGSSVFAGTTTGRIFILDSATGNPIEQTLPATVSGAVTRIEPYVQAFHLMLQRSVVRAYALVGGTLVHFDGTTWDTRPGAWSTFEIERETGRLFAANDSDVFASSDGGQTWTDASAGLPVRPHCTDLRIAANQDGGRDLYLATYGRSAWRTTIALPPPSDKGFHVPDLVSDVLFGVIEDGGGVIRVDGHLHRVPPRPPIRDLLVAIVMDDLAHHMSPARGNAVRRALLQQMRAIVAEELRQLGEP